MGRWFSAAGLSSRAPVALPPAKDKGLTVKIWTAQREAERPAAAERSAA